MSEIQERVAAIIVDKLGVSESQITPEATFAQDLGADSLDTVELIMELEKEFDITIPMLRPRRFKQWATLFLSSRLQKLLNKESLKQQRLF